MILLKGSFTIFLAFFPNVLAIYLGTLSLCLIFIYYFSLKKYMALTKFCSVRFIAVCTFPVLLILALTFWMIFTAFGCATYSFMSSLWTIFANKGPGRGINFSNLFHLTCIWYFIKFYFDTESWLRILVLLLFLDIFL